jgi:positive control factor
MAIGPYVYEDDQPILHAGNWTIHQMGGATLANYGRTLYRLQKLRENTTVDGDREIIGGMIADVNYTMEWLRSGRRPNARRGIERPYSTTTSNVSEIRSWDPKWLEVYRSPSGWSGYQEEAPDEAPDQQWRIDEALHSLSKRERECYVLHHGFGMSERDIARELHLGRDSVKVYLERAEKKIEEEKHSNLFLM